MLSQITKTDLFEELSAEQQELLAGGQDMRFGDSEPEFGGSRPEFGDSEFGDSEFDEPEFGGSSRERGGRGKRVISVPIRLTGTLEVIK
ncbi:MAG: hypothetical protein NWQ28_06080 [Nodularia sp. (in: cyanobacteria)]|nr:hypothetical protein [Nodularia sp. (in: cyanobacteria)]